MPRKHMRAKAITTPVAAADDFKRIKGIGPAIEKRLHAADILTFAELAKLTPVEVSERAGGLSVKIIARQSWSKQAGKLAPQSTDRLLHRTRFRVDLILDGDNVVQYTRAKHIKHEEDEAEPNKWDDGWGNWDERRLINFFVQRGGLKPQLARPPLPLAEMESMAEKPGMPTQEPKAMPGIGISQLLSATQLPPETGAQLAPSSATPIETSAPVEPSVERAPELMEEHDSLQPHASLQRLTEAPAPVSSVTTQVGPSSQLQLAASDMQVFDSPIQNLITGSSSVKRLRAQFSFQLSGAIASEITTAQLSYFVQIFACELSTGHMTVLAADRQMLQAGSILYTPVADFALPETGRYQTFGVVFLSIPDDDSIPNRTRVDVAWGPILKIIP
jgi:hypothetical protein